MEHGEFHSEHGLCFKRMEDGSVRVRLYDPDVRRVQREIDLDASTWASVIAHVSKRGGTPKTHQTAEEFHNQEPDPLTPWG